MPAPKFFKVSSQQFIAIDAIERVDDCGSYVDLVLRNGMRFRVDKDKRASVLEVIESLC